MYMCMTFGVHFYITIIPVTNLGYAWCVRLLPGSNSAEGYYVKPALSLCENLPRVAMSVFTTELAPGMSKRVTKHQ